MNSLMMYRDVCQNHRYAYDKTKLIKIDEIVQYILSEIMVAPYDMNKSSFLKETAELIRMIKSAEMSFVKSAEVYPYDAYVIIKALREKIENDRFTAATMEYSEFAANIFRGMQFRGDQQAEMSEINRWLKEIQKIVDEKKAKEDLRTSEKRTISTNGAEHAGLYRTGNGFETTQVGRPLMQTIEDTGIGKNKSIENSNNCRLNVQEWHRHSQTIQTKLNEMQPMVSETLRTLMGFSNDITENYVLQFARMQINLYNLISDNLDYHLFESKKSGNQDYVNAVSNYQEFLDMIMDNVSAFGVEEISSRMGMRFDGNIHEVIGNADFSPRMSSVKESVRLGFKYKDIIIQKEKIRVWESTK